MVSNSSRLGNRWNLLAIAVIIVILSGVFLTDSLIKTAADEDGDNESPEQWTLSITGLVAEPANITLEELRKLPNTTVRAEMICVSGHSFGVSNWIGVRLWELMETVQVLPSATKLALRAADGYETDIWIEDAMRDDVILAYDKDGGELRESIRLVVPGKWGYKWIAYLTEIELVDYDFRGTWESRGYSDDAVVAQ